MNYEFKAAVHSMMLPVSFVHDEEFLETVRRHLEGVGVAEEDQASWIVVQLRKWKADGSPSQALKQLVKSALFEEERTPKTYIFENIDSSSSSEYKRAGNEASNRYFDIHQALVSTHQFDHDTARQLLSHTGMIVRLAIDEKMTASEITRLISIRDARFELNWRATKAIMGPLKCSPAINQDCAEQTYQNDSEAESSLFSDLDIEGSIAKIGHVSSELGCPGDFENWLLDILIRDLHSPYLLLLHYQLLILAKYDHAVTYAYEFSPRGQVADWLTRMYADAGIPVAKSAFLNNAKATLRFDKVWVTGRTDHLRAASALASILEQMESLSALAKHELAAQIRGLLHRYIRVKSEEFAGGLPEEVPPLDISEIQKLLDGVALGNTGTTGILEQRVVDCLGLTRHLAPDGWSQRGVADSVFAANTYRKKFGDCEFELPDRASPKIMAYEAHGGRLTLPYIDDHMNSFGHVLKARHDELSVLADVQDWDFTVVFVAHSFADDLPPAFPLPFEEGAVSVSLEYINFSAVADEMRPIKNLVSLFAEHVTARINNPFVHPNVRSKAKELAGV